MRKDLALKTILGISVMGMLFSGYLSYNELFKSVCVFGGCAYVLWLPSCVYGFIMYLIVFVISILGLKSGKWAGFLKTI
ncbi:MAG TPA: hypothetical protein VJI75_01490 [Candidatus Nanoarchaeia archaeon]|nr:hypothetical protein [Candidatus Nanoarchaeia archaeon]